MQAAEEVQYMSVREGHRRLKERGAPVALNVLYDQIKANKIPHVRIGKRIFLPTNVLDQMLEAQVEA